MKKMTLGNIPNLAAIILLVIAIGGGFFYFGQLDTKVDHLTEEVGNLSDNLIAAIGSHEHDDKGIIFRDYPKR